MMKRRKEMWMPITAVLLILTFTIGPWVLSSHFEAKTFCKLTGRTDITTWDAMWINLRVDDD